MGPRAGERRTVRRRRSPLTAILVIVVLLAAAGAVWFGRHELASFARTIVDRTTTLDHLNANWVASSSAAGHEAGMLSDGKTDTYWQAAAAGPGIGQTLVGTLAQPKRLVYLQIRTGATESAPQFLKQGRPTVFTVTVTRSDGAQIAMAPITLVDKPGDQQFTIGVDAAASVRLEVVSSQAPSATTSIAVTEIELIGR